MTQIRVTDLGAKLAALRSRGSRVIGPSGKHYGDSLSSFAHLLCDFSATETGCPEPETIRTTLSRASERGGETLSDAHWQRIERVFGLCYASGSPDWRACCVRDFTAGLQALALPHLATPDSTESPSTCLVSRCMEPMTAAGTDILQIDLGPPHQLKSMDIWLNLYPGVVAPDNKNYFLGYSQLRVELDLSKAPGATYCQKTDSTHNGCGWTVMFNDQKHTPVWVVEVDRKTPSSEWLQSKINIEAIGVIINARVGHVLRAKAIIPATVADVVYVGAPEDRPPAPHMEFIAQVMKVATSEGIGGFKKLLIAEQTLDVCAVDLPKAVPI